MRGLACYTLSTIRTRGMTLIQQSHASRVMEGATEKV